jgi:AraC-like DNA-binding protein
MVFDLGQHGIRSVPVLGRYNYTHANPALVDHSHPGAMEICLLARGRQTYSVGGKRFRLQGGDIFVTFPDETHSTGGAPEEKGLLYWMTLLDPAQTKGSLLGLPVAESKALWLALTQTTRRHFPGTADLKKHLDAVLQSIHLPDAALSKVTKINHLIGFLLAMIAARTTALGTPTRPRFEQVLAFVNAHLADPGALAVETLAQIAGLSTSRFKTRFKDELGVPPAEYVLRARIDEARRRLARPDATVTDVAFALGFSSSQYFASSFKRLTNTTPSAFRQAAMRRPRSAFE